MNRTSRLTLPAALLCALVLTASASEVPVSFGSGPNQFNMTFVPIGSLGNAADTTGFPNPAGAVSYTYQMGKYEVSEDMISKFNASQSLTITKDTRGTNKPATSVSWNEAARFVNWLNTSTGGFPAYKFTTGGVNDNIALWTPADTLDYDASNQFRSKRATYVLPTTNEWYKAAFYDPNHGGPGVGGYWDYPTGSDTVPTPVAGGTTPGTAVYAQSGLNPPADITSAGGLSPLGIMGQSGNVWEWQETESDLLNNNPSSNRGWRSGNWFNSAFVLPSTYQNNSTPTLENTGVGFRVASVTPTVIPEPSTYALVLTGLTALGWCRWRRNVTRSSSP